MTQVDIVYLQPWIALLFGILILVVPQILNYLIAAYLILIGIAGLVLPGIQGVFTIVLGAALLSLDNELMYRGLRKVFKRWPKLWHKVEHFRAKAHDRVHRMFHRPK